MLMTIMIVMSSFLFFNLFKLTMPSGVMPCWGVKYDLLHLSMN